MIEVYPNLFVGSQDDEAAVRGQAGWFVVHACKEPYHRNALGYTGQGAPKQHPEYLLAERPRRLILNLVDVAQVAFIAPIIVDTALGAIDHHIASAKVLIHCNQGFSRSPSIALLYLLKYTDALGSQEPATALAAFRKLYPLYAPAQGMADYVRLNWAKYLPPAKS
ncbi:protein-tyrosine phosphatase family protein [Acetobacter thailandicus]|uniref:Dual specificity protein phosphatase family protein n=1 Tax=Acetobacter thailandicus TaxID=1502842 RepID=A0ABT3QHI0_9PROT|nr:dual specificity protein phosphatase family protein [Acetobacter thailandicus]MCX2564737.1 dual specificity protein phosphatase family protein [Acetobacter thailandicus]NHN96219.1 phosphatase [Acetobacter thailandicus]